MDLLCDIQGWTTFYSISSFLNAVLVQTADLFGSMCHVHVWSILNKFLAALFGENILLLSIMVGFTLDMNAE